jgi:predicted Zn-dependent protease
MRRQAILTSLVLIAGVALFYSTRKRDDAHAGVGALWGWLAEAQRETSRVPMTVTRLSDAEEIGIGDRLAADHGLRNLHQHYTYSANDLAMEQNVRRVGNELARRSRRKLTYTFYYLPDSSVFNAYALPGGHIVMGKGLAGHVETEDMLAAVIGHEIEHVDRYHCGERYQIAARVGQLAALPVTLFQAGYSKEQELEADREGTLLAVRAGYSAQAAVRMFEMLERLGEEPHRRAGDPVSEMSSAALQSVSEYFRSHPPAGERKHQIERLINEHHLPGTRERPLADQAASPNVRN